MPPGQSKLVCGSRYLKYRPSMMTKNNFPEIHSTSNRLRTWLIRGIFIIVFGPLVFLLYTLPIAFSVFYYPFMIWMSVLVFRYIKREREASPVRIRYMQHRFGGSPIFDLLRN